MPFPWSTELGQRSGRARRTLTQKANSLTDRALPLFAYSNKFLVPSTQTFFYVNKLNFQSRAFTWIRCPNSSFDPWLRPSVALFSILWVFFLQPDFCLPCAWSSNIFLCSRRKELFPFVYFTFIVLALVAVQRVLKWNERNEETACWVFLASLMGNVRRWCQRELSRDYEELLSWFESFHHKAKLLTSQIPQATYTSVTWPPHGPHNCTKKPPLSTPFIHSFHSALIQVTTLPLAMSWSFQHFPSPNCRPRQFRNKYFVKKTRLKCLQPYDSPARRNRSRFLILNHHQPQPQEDFSKSKSFVLCCTSDKSDSTRK